MNAQSDDPAVRWSALLSSLDGRRREAVVSALRSSAASGHPASEDAVRLLVAYAEHRITASDYAQRMITSMGLAPGSVPAAPVEAAEPAPEPEAPEPSRRASPTRDEAVRAYVAGEMPVEEFLRIARGRTA
jgi:hypothetical protein